MLDITYISELDRRRLVVLNEGLRMCETVEEQQQLREEIAAIEKTRKPLGECTMEECTELRTAIWDKFDRLNRTGKYNIAQNFKLMLRQIESQQMRIHQQVAQEAAIRVSAEQKVRAKELAEAAAKKKANAGKETSSGAKSIVSRWTTGIGNLD